MNTKLVAITVLLIGGAVTLVAMTLGSRGIQEVEVGAVLSGRYPPAGYDAAQTRRDEIKLTGYCVAYDRLEAPRVLTLGSSRVLAPGEASLRVRLEAEATIPEALEPQAEIMAVGHLDPELGEFVAYKLTAKCPSTEQAKKTLPGGAGGEPPPIRP